LQETQTILKNILDRVKVLAVRYARATQGIQQQLVQQGQEMSEHDVKKNFVLPHFESGFQESEDEVLTVSAMFFSLLSLFTQYK
jgi:hypothetical protein